MQFGRPIGSFQAIKHKCADMLLEVESAKSAAYYAGWCAAELNDRAALGRLARQAYCSGLLPRRGREHPDPRRHRVHLGAPAHLYFKRAKSSELLLGDPTYHRELLAQRIGI
ncbi:MAG: acyl-CoA dehydrogenase family protein [Microthrixaceae bacterium]